MSVGELAEAANDNAEEDQSDEQPAIVGDVVVRANQPVLEVSSRQIANEGLQVIKGSATTFSILARTYPYACGISNAK